MYKTCAGSWSAAWPIVLAMACAPPISVDPDAANGRDAASASDSATGADGSAADRAQSDAGNPNDASGSDAHVATEHTAAVVGQRCALDERIGLVDVSGWGAGLSASAWVFDKPNPVFGAFALFDGDCGFHQYNSTACGICSGEQVCGADGNCAAPQVPHTEAQLLVYTPGQIDVQQIDADPITGQIYAPMSHAGSTFSLELYWPGHVVSLTETSVPDELPDLTGTLGGTYDAPTSIDISWTPPADGGHAYTLIPINHHAGGPTFTECTVDAAEGGFQVSGEMLQPLAVSTGLEFQTLDHARFAAAHTSAGCVELRFLVRGFLNLY